MDLSATVYISDCADAEVRWLLRVLRETWTGTPKPASLSTENLKRSPKQNLKRSLKQNLKDLKDLLCFSRYLSSDRGPRQSSPTETKIRKLEHSSMAPAFV